jgi:hypothetical protein
MGCCDLRIPVSYTVKPSDAFARYVMSGDRLLSINESKYWLKPD